MPSHCSGVPWFVERAVAFAESGTWDLIKSAPCHLTEEPAELQHVLGDGWALYRGCAFVTKEIFLLGHSSIKMQFGGH